MTAKLPDISLTGKMGSGKTTVCNYLIENYGYKQLSFAGALKDIVNQLDTTPKLYDVLRYVNRVYSLPAEYGNTFFMLLEQTLSFPREIPKPRLRLQFLGTAVRNKIDKNFWVTLALVTFRDIREKTPDVPIVFDDARFPNEIDILKSKGFVDIILSCTDDTRIKRLEKLYNITDKADSRLFAESETAMDNYKYTHTLINDSAINGNDIVVFDELKKIINKE